MMHSSSYLIARATLESPSRARLCLVSDTSPAARQEVLATKIIPELELYFAAHKDVTSVILDYEADQLDVVTALRQLHGKNNFRVAYVGGHPQRALSGRANAIDFLLELPSSEKRVHRFLYSAGQHLGLDLSPQLSPGPSQEQRLRAYADDRSPTTTSSAYQDRSPSHQQVQRAAALPITNMAIPARTSSHRPNPLPLAPHPSQAPLLNISPPSPAPTGRSKRSFASTLQTWRSGLSHSSSLRTVTTTATARLESKQEDDILASDLEEELRLRPTYLATIEQRRSGKKALKWLGITS
jgi:hypothetical protein